MEKLRAGIAEAREVYNAAYDKRLAARREAAAKGEDPPVYNDMMDWLDQHAKGRPFDAVLAQLLIAQAMIHGTADLSTQVIFDIVERPELVEELRAVILSVIGEQGLTMVSLSNLHLMNTRALRSRQNQIDICIPSASHRKSVHTAGRYIPS